MYLLSQVCEEKPLPSPSHTKAEHIAAFVVGDLPPEGHFQPAKQQQSVSQETQSTLKLLLQRYVRLHTEMETMFPLVLEAITRVKNVNLELHLQASLEDNPVFTDFYLLVREHGSVIPLLLIEAKNIATSTRLLLTTPPTAQVLREVHIVLNKYTSTHKLPFILTNSATWGIGEAEGVTGGKIRITSNIRHDVSIPIHPTESAVLCLVDHLEKLISTGLNK